MKGGVSIQIVINISNTLKNLIDQNDLKTLSHAMWQFIMIDAIKNGTPLPKGHGRLIDAKEAEKKMAVTLDEDIGSQSVARYILRTPSETPTIVEADKEDEA